MPREQPAKDRRFPAWTQRGTTARLGAAGRHAGNHGSAAHQQIMHRVIQRIYFSAQRGKGGIGGRGRGGFIVHARPILRGSIRAFSNQVESLGSPENATKQGFSARPVDECERDAR
jgi:hypothetical protein